MPAACGGGEWRLLLLGSTLGALVTAALLAAPGVQLVTFGRSRHQHIDHWAHAGGGAGGGDGVVIEQLGDTCLLEPTPGAVAPFQCMHGLDWNVPGCGVDPTDMAACVSPVAMLHTPLPGRRVGGVREGPSSGGASGGAAAAAAAVAAAAAETGSGAGEGPVAKEDEGEEEAEDAEGGARRLLGGGGTAASALEAARCLTAGEWAPRPGIPREVALKGTVEAPERGPGRPPWALPPQPRWIFHPGNASAPASASAPPGCLAAAPRRGGRAGMLCLPRYLARRGERGQRGAPPHQHARLHPAPAALVHGAPTCLLDVGPPWVWGRAPWMQLGGQAGALEEQMGRPARNAAQGCGCVGPGSWSVSLPVLPHPAYATTACQQAGCLSCRPRCKQPPGLSR